MSDDSLSIYFLQVFGSLVELNLSRNQLLFFPFQILRYCSHLEVLNVSGNMLQAGTSFLSVSVSFSALFRYIYS